mmetsp:Transcript_14506/g.26013  ORF Transcript_14506/g.26013 Transcript_14506/m.26013 type:complete len:232 (+) Transcript_14506:1122-1817(+)
MLLVLLFAVASQRPVFPSSTVFVQFLSGVLPQLWRLLRPEAVVDAPTLSALPLLAFVSLQMLYVASLRAFPGYAELSGPFPFVGLVSLRALKLQGHVSFPRQPYVLLPSCAAISACVIVFLAASGKVLLFLLFVVSFCALLPLLLCVKALLLQVRACVPTWPVFSQQDFPSQLADGALPLLLIAVCVWLAPVSHDAFQHLWLFAVFAFHFQASSPHLALHVVPALRLLLQA